MNCDVSSTKKIMGLIRFSFSDIFNYNFKFVGKILTLFVSCQTAVWLWRTKNLQKHKLRLPLSSKCMLCCNFRVITHNSLFQFRIYFWGTVVPGSEDAPKKCRKLEIVPGKQPLSILKSDFEAVFCSLFSSIKLVDGYKLTVQPTFAYVY